MRKSSDHLTPVSIRQLKVIHEWSTTIILPHPAQMHSEAAAEIAPSWRKWKTRKRRIADIDPKGVVSKLFFMKSYTAVIKESDEWWIGWIEEIPGINCQGRTREELTENLSSALREAIEMHREAAIAAAEGDYQEQTLVL